MKIDVIKIYYERAKYAKLPDGDIDYQKQEEFLFWMLDSGHLGKLIERVQELDKKNSDYWLENDTLHKTVDYLEQQNKHLRRELEGIRKFSKDTWAVYRANIALEESE